MILIPDFFEAFIAGLDLSSSVVSSSYDAAEDRTTITAENTYHLRYIDVGYELEEQMEVFISASFEEEILAESGNTLTVESTKGLTEGSAVSIAGVDLLVSNVTATTFDVDTAGSYLGETASWAGTASYFTAGCDALNNTFQVIGEVLSPTAIRVENPNFYHGTPYATNTKLSAGTIPSRDRFPMVYLGEPLLERIPATGSSWKVEIPNTFLFFLDADDYANNDTDLSYEEVILGLRRLVEAFMLAVQGDACCFNNDEQEFEIKNHVKFGEEGANGNHVQSIFNYRMSGVEVRASYLIKDCKKLSI